jgi:hypothetical protein
MSNPYNESLERKDLNITNREVNTNMIHEDASLGGLISGDITITPDIAYIDEQTDEIGNNQQELIIDSSTDLDSKYEYVYNKLMSDSEPDVNALFFTNTLIDVNFVYAPPNEFTSKALHLKELILSKLSNSITDTFMDDFKRMNEVFAEDKQKVNSIKVTSGTSKAGREFITCVYVG